MHSGSTTGIPSSAHRVFKGVIFDVYQWEQQLYDGRTAIFEKLWRPNTVEAVAVVGDKIIIQTQEQPGNQHPFISLPGGRCDGDEDPLKAAKRELLEETGYVSDDWELWSNAQPYGKIIWCIYRFIARNCTSQKEPKLDGGEMIVNKLVSFDEFISLSDNPQFRDIDMVNAMLRMRLNTQEKEAFKRVLFKS